MKVTHTLDGSVHLNHTDMGGTLHNQSGPACLMWQEMTGTFRAEWYRHGHPHRADGPAKRTTFRSNETSIFVWYQDDQRQRKDGPSTAWVDGYLDWRALKGFVASTQPYAHH